MSARAIAWAESIRHRTAAQTEVLMNLAELADDSGTVRRAYKALEAFPSTMTPPQVKKAAEALVSAQLATQRWDMDTYSWTITLHVVTV